MKPLADCRLYAFVDTAYLQGRAPELVAQQLCDGGADLIQLRAKASTPNEIRQMAEKSCPSPGWRTLDWSSMITRTSPRLRCGICHLGQEDFFDAGHKHVIELWGMERVVRIGLSTHSPEQAKRALAAGADYIAVGPVYATGTKPTTKPVTLEYVRWAAAPQSGVNIPWFAIGGITLGNLDDVLAAGARRIVWCRQF